MRRIIIRFGQASPSRLPLGALPSTYTDKPLVTFNGAAMFGELAIVRWLEVDGWDAVWLDTVHGRKVWRGMPTTSFPASLPAVQQQIYDSIIAANGGRASGTFDVMAWKHDHTIFVEYRGREERPSKHAARWIEAATRTGVSENDLFVISAETS